MYRLACRLPFEMIPKNPLCIGWAICYRFFSPIRTKYVSISVLLPFMALANASTGQNATVSKGASIFSQKKKRNSVYRLVRMLPFDFTDCSPQCIPKSSRSVNKPLWMYRSPKNCTVFPYRFDGTKKGHIHHRHCAPHHHNLNHDYPYMHTTITTMYSQTTIFLNIERETYGE